MNNVLILTYWSLSDALIQTYTLPYVRIIKSKLPPGSTIWLVTLEKEMIDSQSAAKKEIENSLSKDGILWLPFGYQPLGVKAFLMWSVVIVRLLKIIIGKRVSTIHCWATPAGAIGYLLSVFTGRNLVVDSYEPHAEAMVENGTWPKNGFAFRLLFWFEKKQSHRASAVISATAAMRQYAREKYNVRLVNFWVKPACVDMTLFSQDKIKNKALVKELKLENKIVCVYAGKLGGIYLEHEVFDFFKVAHDFWGDRFRVVLLSRHTNDEVEKYCRHAQLDPAVIKLKFVPHVQVPDYMGLGDFAITPVKPVSTKKYCTPIKDGEYWALGLPVVIPANISDDSDIIKNNDAGVVLDQLNRDEYLSAVQKIDQLLGQDRQKLFSRIQTLATEYRSFRIAEEVYGSVYRKSAG